MPEKYIRPEDLEFKGFVAATSSEMAARIAYAQFGPGVYITDPFRVAPGIYGVYRADNYQYLGNVFARSPKEARMIAAQQFGVEDVVVDRISSGQTVYAIYRVKEEALPTPSPPPVIEERPAPVVPPIQPSIPPIREQPPEREEKPPEEKREEKPPERKEEEKPPERREEEKPPEMREEIVRGRVTWPDIIFFSDKVRTWSYVDNTGDIRATFTVRHELTSPTGRRFSGSRSVTLDPGRSTGVGINHPTGLPESGTWRVEISLYHNGKLLDRTSKTERK